ncbi:MAG: hypothetical protein IT492_09825 [Gammaproteobacteria bacterium]|nr:hypothetical protein [Gammaproteobacteria bacterium]
MATGLLKTWLAQRDSTLRWIEFEAYARRVFANNPADWYRDPVRYAATLIQAQGVVGSHCVSIDITAPFMAAHDGGELPALFAASAPFDFVSEALNALTHRFEGRLDLVLKMTAPWDLLGGGDDASFDAMDDLGTALAACMRRFSDRPVAGLLLETARIETLSADEIDAYEPLVSAARHYGWVTAMALPADRHGAVASVGLDLDVLLWPQLALDAIPAAGGKPAHGGGLNDDVWSAAAVVPTGAQALLYGVIPATATPETIISITGAFKA